MTFESITMPATVWQWARSDHGLTVLSTILSIIALPVAIAAIIVGVRGIREARDLFKKLETTLNQLVTDIKENALRETLTVATSYAAFTRALQAVELDPMELPKDGAFALLTSFHFQKLLNPSYTPEQSSELQKLTRKSVDVTAHGYVEMLLKSGLGTMKDGIELNDPPR